MTGRGRSCLKKGAAALSDSEILGILIGKGMREKTAVDLGKELLKKIY